MDNKDHEIQILDKIAKTTHIKQRELSKDMGLSLGMTNAIIRRLIKKGLLKMRKLNNKTIQYLISPLGMKAIAQKSFAYFKRTVSIMVLYRKTIIEIIDDCLKEGYNFICLVGASDIDFIIEHYCFSEGLKFQRDESVRNKIDTLYLISEQFEPLNQVIDSQKNVIYLRPILLSV
jgi:DNA-binding Lrp family transcriptional regulator